MNNSQVVSVEVMMGEAGFGSLEGNIYDSIQKAEADFEKIPKEDIGGYDKVFLTLTFSDDSTKYASYYHSKKYSKLSGQIEHQLNPQ